MAEGPRRHKRVPLSTGGLPPDMALDPVREAQARGEGAGGEHRLAMQGMSPAEKAAYRQSVADALGDKPEGEGRLPRGKRPPAPGGATSRGGGRRGSTRRPSPRVPGTPTLRRPLGQNVPVGFGGTGLAGVFLGAVAYAIILSVVEKGTAGPGMWFKAKFLNEAPGSGSGSGSKPAPSGPAVGPGGVAPYSGKPV